jgi:pyruvate dehydrogenase E1 component beta subunit
MEAIYTHVPGLKVVVPSTPFDAKGLLLAAIEDPDPVIYLEPIRLYRAVKEDVPDEWFTLPMGSARIEREGDDVTLITWGAMTKETREAADLLADEEISAEVIDLRSLVPLDLETLVDSVERTGRAVVIHEAPRTSGFGGEVVAALQEECLFSLAAPILRVTGWDTVFPLKRSEHHYLPSARRIAAAALRTLEG